MLKTNKFEIANIASRERREVSLAVFRRRMRSGRYEGYIPSLRIETVSRNTAGFSRKNRRYDFTNSNRHGWKGIIVSIDPL